MLDAKRHLHRIGGESHDETTLHTNRPDPRRNAAARCGAAW
jgi:hypothetical protein